MKKRVIVVDIDGTVADNVHRQHLAPSKSEQESDSDAWRSFHEASVNDTPVEHVCMMVEALRQFGMQVVFLTARPEWSRSITTDWLRRNVVEDQQFQLAMRPNDSVEKASQLKPRLLRSLFYSDAEMTTRVFMVLEDSESNAQAFESMGLPVLRVRGYGQDAIERINELAKARDTVDVAAKTMVR